MTEWLCRKALNHNICTDDPRVKTAAEANGYICVTQTAGKARST
jgi:hypothetical protein